MAFKIIWSTFAENQLDRIFEYYAVNAGHQVASKLLQEITAAPNTLINNPEIGQKEEWLLNRKVEYRYLICKNYKLIYSIDETRKLIKIADVFDTRQNPVKIKRSK